MARREPAIWQEIVRMATEQNQSIELDFTTAEGQRAFTRQPSGATMLMGANVPALLTGTSLARSTCMAKLQAERVTEIGQLTLPPTAGDVKAIYEQNRAAAGTRTLAELAPVIERSLRERRLAERAAQFRDELKAKTGVKVTLDAPRVAVTVPADARWLTGEGPGADDAEPFADFAARVQSFLQEVLVRHPEETVLVVAHGGSIRVIHALAGGLDYVRDHRSIPGVPNCTVARYAAREGKLAPLD